MHFRYHIGQTIRNGNRQTNVVSISIIVPHNSVGAVFI